MWRYLISIYLHDENYLSPKISYVGEQLTRPRKFLMKDSLFFFFAHSSKTKEEIEDAFLGQKMGPFISISFQTKLRFERTVYLFGELINVDNQLCYLDQNKSIIIPLESFSNFSKFVIINNWLL